jgi:hypothetical protein
LTVRIRPIMHDVPHEIHISSDSALVLSFHSEQASCQMEV